METTQCKKLVRCEKKSEEHGSYCKDHTVVRKAKKYCEVVLNGTHQCSNYARTGETKCASHGEKRFILRITAEVCGKWGWPIHGYEQTSETRMAARKVLNQVWNDYIAENAGKNFHPLHEKFYWKTGASWAGRRRPICPYYEVRLMQAEARVPVWETTFPAEIGDKTFKVKVWAHGE